MQWTTHSQPVPLSELGWANTAYLASTSLRCDPMLVWGTIVDTDELDTFIEHQRLEHNLMLTIPHVLVRAVAEALHRHPELNRRVIGRQVYPYKGVNIVMPMLQTSSGEADCVFLHDAETLTLAEITRLFWEEARTKARMVAQERKAAAENSPWKSRLSRLLHQMKLYWIHKACAFGFRAANMLRAPVIWPWQEGMNRAGAFVNYLGFPEAPPMIAFKPSALPLNSFCLSVTMGATERRPVVVENDRIEIRKQAPLFVRFDHRLVNGHQSAEFLQTLRSFIAHPELLMPQIEQPLAQAA